MSNILNNALNITNLASMMLITSSIIFIIVLIFTLQRYCFFPTYANIFICFTTYFCANGYFCECFPLGLSNQWHYLAYEYCFNVQAYLNKPKPNF